ncbi:DUF6884 domain-containing protein [Streptomyces graminilatus]|uniref:DUF6884 domain-containing protein n=1 Tax=Streptomyces graminilatus TaxID=1464070 RepID=UPI0012FF11BF|nr:DUF6884 domain-containing protein [Streptomyces graminilatus]
MTNKIEVHLPATARKWATRTMDADTQAERDLMDACKALGLGNSQRSTTVPLTNSALGVLIRQARKWVIKNDNNNEWMAGKSILARHEMDYAPDDPRETRHEIKLPASLSGSLVSPYVSDFAKDTSIPEAVKEDLLAMTWAKTGASGRVRTETLGWLLGKMDRFKDYDSSAVKRAALKFIGTHTGAYEQTGRLINGYLGTGEEDDAPKEATKRLVLVACGGKKSQRQGKIPAGERYIGNYFTACLMASEVMDGVTMVLSAKYGLIPLTEEIENYDVTMGDKDSVRLGFVKRQVEELGLKNATVTVLGGERYVKAARQIWPDAEAPLKGGIGQQLKQLAEMYSGDPLDEDEHQDQEHEGPDEWKSGQFRNVMGLPGRYHSHGLVVWFGGKAGKRNPQPGQWVKVNVIYIGEGRYDLIDVKTDQKVMTCSLVSQIHWSPAQTPMRKEEPAAVEETMPPGGYEVPANFLELAEEGNTDQAKAYWKRRCEEYRRTGK